MTDSTFTLVDARGRKYLTAKERERFLAAVRSHPKPAVQTLARTLAMTGCRVSEALGVRACDVDLEAGELLRHRDGVAAVAAGVPLPSVAEVLGHTSLTTTVTYTTAIRAEERELVSRVRA